ncbi:FGGY-family carbohydrate kinase [Streptococcus sciuri]|uniref:Carbohydrate kinase n=1 Tax=Streptococcus sciuri TaxID=2973939 RepID=A0ABT2F6C6_9STRE|nr:FGGY-family carbohydrate kinase [Streptococcus sciuri]MCS4487999.1 carbohydrate kinase [Streptococcus sciuri]
MRYLLSIDYGGTNTKAVIFDESGQQLASSAFSTKVIEQRAGFREVDLQETWKAISYAIWNVLKLSQLKPEQIAAVACIGHGKGLYLLDKNHKEFFNGILSADSRGSELASQFEARLEEIWSLTRQHVVAPQSPVLLRWLKEYDSEIYEQIGAVLSAKDYIRFKLTGLVQQEIGDASGNHWINFETGQYDEQITEFFGIEEMADVLAPLVDYAEVVGGVSSEAAAETGLVAGTPVIGGLFDIDACAIGSGVLNAETFGIIAGTWSINVYPSKTSASRSTGLMNSYFPNRDFLIEASSPTSAGNLDAILKMLTQEEIRNHKENGRSIYDSLEELLVATSASYSKIIFLPFLYGSNVGQEAESCFFGLTTQSSKSEMVRAVYEGIVYAHKQHVEDLLKTVEQSPKVLRLSGGGTNSPAWMQMFADILELPVEITEATEVGGLGGAIACLQALDKLDLTDSMEKMVCVKERFEPRLAESQMYQKKYRLYQKLLEALTPVWSDLCELRKE